ncbi:MAG: class I SAM-dependent methyltransferase [bacterium]|nr:class I SAM-dependent methyltransferase [bacterium]
MTSFDYTGKENLDAMALAVRYNDTIYRWLRRGLQTDGSILEFGAGKGEFCNRFAKRRDVDHPTTSDTGEQSPRIQAVELDAAMHSEIICPAVCNIEDVDGRFDLIYAVNVLEHIKDDVATVRDFHRRLNPGGRVKIFVPARRELFSNMDVLVGHERRYHPAGLRELFRENGFRVLDCRYFDCLGYFATLLYKWTGGAGEVSPASIRIYDSLIFPLSRLADILTGGRIIGKNLVFEAVRVD